MDLTFGNIPDYTGIGIYCITNTVTGKLYIGKSQNIQKRIKQHILSFKSQKCTPKILSDIKNGAHLEFSILEKLKSPSTAGKLYDRERYWVKHYNSVNDGYNSEYPSPVYDRRKRIYAK